MDANRRQFLKIGAAAGAVGALGGCRSLFRETGLESDVAVQPVQNENQPQTRFLNRIGFGFRPGELARLNAIGREGYLDEQLDANQPEPAHLTLALNRLDVLRMEGMELRDLPEDEILNQLQLAAILNAVYSPNQLRERMADFWTNHFNIYGRKGWSAYRKAKDEMSVVRKHALGSFPEMVKASSQSAAMLVYLDNNFNRAGVPNENYARELLELHTLGVDGGYTYKDIVEVSRCLTGWTTEVGFLRPVGKVVFKSELHDDGPKTVLGHSIPAGLGAEDIDVVLKILVEHPSTARHLARKLCLAFLGEEPKSVSVRVARAYLQSNGDIAAMIRVILSSEEVHSSKPVLKRPFDFVVSALRTMDVDSIRGNEVQNHLRAMGQPTYEWPMPDGYPADFSSWTGSLLARWNFAWRLMNGGIGVSRPRLSELRTTFKGDDLDYLAALVFGSKSDSHGLGDWARLAREILASGSEDSLHEAAALALSSPAFQWR